ncbi:MAG TPA: hypothetical protein VGB94_14145 [Acidobacteriaceae bacterium]
MITIVGGIILAVVGLFALPAYAQVSEQSWCAKKVHGNIEATKRDRPEIYRTMKDYTFEWSRSAQACVMIVQYAVHQTGKPNMVQILAINAVTMQNMEGYDNIYLVPENDRQAQMDAVNFLFKRWSR